jgi:hypothetical protein
MEIKNFKRVFTDIYHSKQWGENRVGPGSIPENLSEYFNIISPTTKDKIVLDVGCNMFTSLMPDNNYKQLIGIDVLPRPDDIPKNAVYFETFNFLMDGMLHNDLKTRNIEVVLCKDVLQHWPIIYILLFFDVMSRILPKESTLIVTNDIYFPSDEANKMLNAEIKIGEYRPIDLSDKIFTNTCDYKIVESYTWLSKADQTKKNTLFFKAR